MLKHCTLITKVQSSWSVYIVSMFVECYECVLFASMGDA